MRTTLYFTLILLTFVTIALIPNSFAGESDLPKQPQEQERPIVKVIYFIPNDRSSQTMVNIGIKETHFCRSDLRIATKFTDSRESEFPPTECQKRIQR